MGKIIELKYGPCSSELSIWQSFSTVNWKEAKKNTVLMVTFSQSVLISA